MQKKLDGAIKTMEQARKANETHNNDIQKLDEELAEVKKSKDEYDARIAGESQNQGREELDSVNREQKSDEDQLDNIYRLRTESENKHRQKGHEKEEIEKRIEKLAEHIRRDFEKDQRRFQNSVPAVYRHSFTSNDRRPYDRRGMSYRSYFQRKREDYAHESRESANAKRKSVNDKDNAELCTDAMRRGQLNSEDLVDDEVLGRRSTAKTSETCENLGDLIVDSMEDEMSKCQEVPVNISIDDSDVPVQSPPHSMFEAAFVAFINKQGSSLANPSEPVTIDELPFGSRETIDLTADNSTSDDEVPGRRNPTKTSETCDNLEDLIVDSREDEMSKCQEVPVNISKDDSDVPVQSPPHSMFEAAFVAFINKQGSSLANPSEPVTIDELPFGSRETIDLTADNSTSDDEVPGRRNAAKTSETCENLEDLIVGSVEDEMSNCQEVPVKEDSDVPVQSSPHSMFGAALVAFINKQRSSLANPSEPITIDDLPFSSRKTIDLTADNSTNEILGSDDQVPGRRSLAKTSGTCENLEDLLGKFVELEMSNYLEGLLDITKDDPDVPVQSPSHSMFEAAFEAFINKQRSSLVNPSEPGTIDELPFGSRETIDLTADNSTSDDEVPGRRNPAKTSKTCENLDDLIVDEMSNCQEVPVSKEDSDVPAQSPPRSICEAALSASIDKQRTSRANPSQPIAIDDLPFGSRETIDVTNEYIIKESPAYQIPLFDEVSSSNQTSRTDSYQSLCMDSNPISSKEPSIEQTTTTNPVLEKSAVSSPVVPQTVARLFNNQEPKNICSQFGRSTYYNLRRRAKSTDARQVNCGMITRSKSQNLGVAVEEFTLSSNITKRKKSRPNTPNRSPSRPEPSSPRKRRKTTKPNLNSDDCTSVRSSALGTATTSPSTSFSVTSTPTSFAPPPPSAVCVQPQTGLAQTGLPRAPASTSDSDWNALLQTLGNSIRDEMDPVARGTRLLQLATYILQSVLETICVTGKKEHPEILLDHICHKKVEIVCQCRRTVYYPQECQIKHWPNHQLLPSEKDR